MDSFIGEIRVFGFNYAPYEWAFCNGQTASIQQSTALFALVGTRYGGDGRYTFCLPNMQGYAPIGAGAGTGLTPRALGQVYGEEVVALNQYQLPVHDHTLTLKASTNFGALTAEPTAGQSTLTRVVHPTSASAATNVNEFVAPPVTNLTPLNANTCGVTGNGLAHENRQPYLAMNFCIALNGVFPVNPN